MAGCMRNSQAIASCGALIIDETICSPWSKCYGNTAVKPGLVATGGVKEKLVHYAESVRAIAFEPL